MTAPERILAWPSAGQYQGVSLAGGNPDCMVEYIRADLAPAAPKVKALVEAWRGVKRHPRIGLHLQGCDAQHTWDVFLDALAALEGGDA